MLREELTIAFGIVLGIVSVGLAFSIPVAAERNDWSGELNNATRPLRGTVEVTQFTYSRSC